MNHPTARAITSAESQAIFFGSFQLMMNSNLRSRLEFGVSRLSESCDVVAAQPGQVTVGPKTSVPRLRKRTEAMVAGAGALAPVSNLHFDA